MFQVTVTVNVGSREAARQALEAAGFTVTRVTAPKATTGAVTARNPFTRPDSRTDRPVNLDGLETAAYVRGYAKACMSYAKKNGIPRAYHAGREALTLVTREYEWDRHPAAHRAGLAELAKEQAHPTRQTVEVAA